MFEHSRPSRTVDMPQQKGADGDLPDMTAIIHTLHRELKVRSHMMYPIVDFRPPAEVPHWPAFAAWSASRRCSVGPQEETKSSVWVCADATTGFAVASRCSTGVHEVATLFSLAQDPCQKWEFLELGKATQKCLSSWPFSFRS